jgi:hypothetical protein
MRIITIAALAGPVLAGVLAPLTASAAPEQPPFCPPGFYCPAPPPPFPWGWHDGRPWGPPRHW